LSVQFCRRLNLFSLLGAKKCNFETPKLRNVMAGLVPTTTLKGAEDTERIAVSVSPPSNIRAVPELKPMGWRHFQVAGCVVSDACCAIPGRSHPAANCLRWAVRSVGPRWGHEGRELQDLSAWAPASNPIRFRALGGRGASHEFDAGFAYERVLRRLSVT
jgi:hypothetical protein